MPNILITGGTSGLGLELVKCFREAGFTVFTTGRDPSKLKELGEGINFVKMNMSDLDEVRQGTNELISAAGNFDIVINNAGVLSPSVFTETINGLEYSFQVNFLSHLLISELVIARKRPENQLVIVFITSPVYKYYSPRYIIPDAKSYHPFRTYSESKIYMLLALEYLLEKYKDRNITGIGFNPGIFRSGISRMKKKWFRIIYKIAAPFMRNPSLVAGNLFKILKIKDNRSGIIFSGPSDPGRTIDIGNKKKPGLFMKECYGFLEAYLSV